MADFDTERGIYAEHIEDCDTIGCPGCDPEDQEPEDPEDLIQRTYTAYRGYTRPDGRVEVEWQTNDDQDRGYTGYSGDVARAHYGPFADRAAFLDFAGGPSRIGCLGGEVDVFLDGERLERAD